MAILGGSQGMYYDTSLDALDITVRERMHTGSIVVWFFENVFFI